MSKFFVPSKSNVVNILGQVLSPTTVVYDPKLSYKKYVGLAGGYNYYADKKNKLLFELSLQEIINNYKNLDKNVIKIFDVNNSMNSKKSHGGTSAANVKAMIKKYKKEVKWKFWY